MKWIGIAVVLVACGGNAARPGTTAVLHAACAAGTTRDGARCAPLGQADAELARGREALAAFQRDAAVEHLERARAAEPHPLERYVEILEQLGIAHAYRGDGARARGVFDLLLTLDPGHLLSYTLSPQVTLLFARAREAAQDRPAPELQVSWPYGLDTTQPIPIGVEVVSDPEHLLARASLFVRRRGEKRFLAVDLELPRPGGYRKLRVPPVGSARPTVLQLYLSAYDRAGNEVLRWGDPARPREIALSYAPSTPWYRTWWVWALAGGAAVVATGAIVFLVVDEPPDAVGGGFHF